MNGKTILQRAKAHYAAARGDFEGGTSYPMNFVILDVLKLHPGDPCDIEGSGWHELHLELRKRYEEADPSNRINTRLGRMTLLEASYRGHMASDYAFWNYQGLAILDDPKSASVFNVEDTIAQLINNVNCGAYDSRPWIVEWCIKKAKARVEAGVDCHYSRQMCEPGTFWQKVVNDHREKWVHYKGVPPAGAKVFA